MEGPGEDVVQSVEVVHGMVIEFYRLGRLFSAVA